MRSGGGRCAVDLLDYVSTASDCVAVVAAGYGVLSASEEVDRIPQLGRSLHIWNRDLK